ncbi:MAG: AsmA family protein [Tannerellaceae bacterium]|jgi:uncharacterized protein involved in outer membrane biogenesis|nr:AsmA family protein [Tannerellaceae bacterium]
MAKSLKKALIAVGALLVVIIGLAVCMPFLFKDTIKTAVVKIVNQQINATVDIGDFGLSLFKNFPDATLSLYDVTIAGVDDFEKDTLLQAKAASLAINLYSLFEGNYEVSSIHLDCVSVSAKIAANGKANWDIVKESVPATDGTEGDTPFHLSLNKITVKDCSITYLDDTSRMKAVLTKWNGNLSGDFSVSQTSLRTGSTIDEVTVVMDGIPYLNKVKALANAEISADLDRMKFTFTHSQLQLNELKVSIEGSFAMPDDDSMDFDLKLNAPGTQFKDVLSLIPAMYTADFKDVKTSGTASLEGYVKGTMKGENYPAFDMKISVGNAMFQYPSLPKPVDNINLHIALQSKGGSLNNTVADISKFSFTLGGNPFTGNLHITTPMADPNLKMYASGTINLGMIKEVYPLETGTELNGKIEADLNLAARMSEIEKEQYENVSASGTLRVSDMVYKSKEMQDIQIHQAGLEFTPRYVNLASLRINIGKNDLSATGRLENFIACMLKDQTIKGELNIQSTYLNANDFLGNAEIAPSETTSPDSTATASPGHFIIPENVDFALNASLKEIVYDKITISDMDGNMSVRNGVLKLNDVSAKALGGTCKVNGSYDTSDPEKPKVNFGLNLSKVSFAETFKSVESVQKFAPVFENLIGSYSMNLNFNTSLGESILQTLAHLAGNGVLQTNDVKVENVAAMNALSSALKTDALKSFSAKDLNLPFTISDGKIDTKPFSLNIGNGGMLKLEGSTGLDQSINYKGIVTLPKIMANDYIKDVPITIGGTFASPRIGVDLKSIAKEAATAMVEEAIGKLSGGEEAVDLSEEKAKQIEKLRQEADNAAKKLVAEAQKQADNLVEKAGNNFIAKTAAQVAGKKLLEEAQKQAERLRNEAEKQIEKLE